MQKDEKKILLVSLVLIGGGYYLLKDKLKRNYKAYTTPTKSNTEHLNSLNPQVKPLFVAFINQLIREGYKPQINSSYRTFQRQAELKKEDKRNASAGFSPHNYGIAIDVQLNKNGKIYGKDTPVKQWLLSGVPSMADKLGLAWGGIFKGYPDSVHFYVKGMDTTKLYKMAVNQFKTSDPRIIQGNRLKLA